MGLGLCWCASPLVRQVAPASLSRTILVHKLVCGVGCSATFHSVHVIPTVGYASFCCKRYSPLVTDLAARWS